MSNINILKDHKKFLCCLLLTAVLLMLCLLKITTYIKAPYYYHTFEVSDWLINFQGGFVRRGITGEILHLIYSITPYSVKTGIKMVNIISFIIVFALLIKCRKYTSILPFLVVYASIIRPLGWYRRDFLVFIIAYLVFYFYMRYIKGKNAKDFLLSQLMSALVLLIHEASFFFVFPILVVINWFHAPGCTPIIQRVASTLKAFSFPFLVMCLLSVTKGNEETANIVWQSWEPLFAQYPEAEPFTMGEGVEWLMNDVSYAADWHLSWNFHTEEGMPGIICSIVMLLVSLFFSYIITLRAPHIDIKNKSLKMSPSNSSTADIMLLQFVFLIPMFTFLSTDYGRTVLYCVVSSTFITYLMQRNVICLQCPTAITNISASINKHIEKRTFLYSPWTYFIIIILYPLSPWHYIELPDDMFIYKYIVYILDAMGIQ